MQAQIPNWKHFVCWGASYQVVTGKMAKVTRVCVMELEESSNISKSLYK